MDAFVWRLVCIKVDIEKPINHYHTMLVCRYYIYVICTYTWYIHDTGIELTFPLEAQLLNLKDVVPITPWSLWAPSWASHSGAPWHGGRGGGNANQSWMDSRKWIFQACPRATCTLMECRCGWEFRSINKPGSQEYTYRPWKRERRWTCLE